MEQLKFLKGGEDEYTYLGSGKRSDAYVYQGFAVKFIRDIPAGFNAATFGKYLSDQYHHIRENLPDYTLETTYVVGQTEPSQGINLVQFQPYIEGISLPEALSQWRQKNKNIDQIKDFFQQCLDMRQRTKFIPDVFGGFHIPFGYKPWQTRNVTILEEENAYRPVLVDTNFGRNSTDFLGRNLRNPLLDITVRAFLRTLQ